MSQAEEAPQPPLREDRGEPSGAPNGSSLQPALSGAEHHTISRTGSTGSATSEALALLNLNSPLVPRHVTTSSSVPYRAPAAVAWLVGTWKGKGKGIFPTIKDFEYMEECSFDWDDKNPRPLLFYRQKTFSTKGHPPKPMHAESGYVRVISAGLSTSSSAASTGAVSRVEMIVSAPNGVCTVEEGTVEGYVIKVRLTSTVKSSSARPPFVTGLERTYTVDPTANPPTLHYVIDMATTKTPTLTRHLEAFLTKWTDDPGSDTADDSEPA